MGSFATVTVRSASSTLTTSTARAANFGGADKFWHEGDFNYDALVN